MILWTKSPLQPTKRSGLGFHGARSDSYQTSTHCVVVRADWTDGPGRHSDCPGDTQNCAPGWIRRDIHLDVLLCGVSRVGGYRMRAGMHALSIWNGGVHSPRGEPSWRGFPLGSRLATWSLSGWLSQGFSLSSDQALPVQALANEATLPRAPGLS